MRWLVLPPSADRSVWISAISKQATSAGLKVFQDHEIKVDADIVITEDANNALEANVDLKDLAVLLSQAGPLAADLASHAPDGRRHDIVRTSSEKRLNAYKIPSHRRFTAEQVSAGPVVLFENFSLHIPHAAPSKIERRNSALVTAMSIYEEVEASWSPDILDIYAKVIHRTDNAVTLDVTGKPRFIVHGPYITMPLGTWKLDAYLEFDKSLCDKMFSVQWGAVDEYSRIDIRPDKAGLYKIQMDWTWTTASPCEFRLIASEGIFDGNITLQNLNISRHKN